MVDVLGSRLGRYELRERLGRGGMATVYKAWDANLDRWVAVKVLHDHLADESDFKQRFEREAKLVAALSHPNIVQIYDFDQAQINNQPVYYMVMPFINGPTLRQVMERDHESGALLSPDAVEHVMQSVCSALAYAHKQGMVHRDVTPNNILFNEQGDVVLADFGLARLASGTRLTQTGTTTGTPVYMSPEQGMGLPGDARSDLYSLGVIVFEMLTGVAPYDGDSAFAIIMKHVNEPVPIDALTEKNVSTALGLFVGRALAKDPEDRFQSANEMLKAFEDAAHGVLPTAVRPVRSTIVLDTPEKPKNIVRNVSKTAILTEPRPNRLPLVSLISSIIVIALIGGAVLLRTSSTTNAPPAVNVPPVATLRILPTARHSAVANAMTDSSRMFSDDFSKAKDASWLLDSEDPDNIHKEFIDGVLRIQNKLAGTALPTVINPRSAEYGRPIVIEADMTLSAKVQPPAATGIVFRYENNDSYYVFAFDGVQRVSIWLRKEGQWTELRKQVMEWTPAEGVNPPGQKNHLKLIVDGDHLQGFINTHPVIDLNSPSQIMTGGVGVYLATTTNTAETDPYAAVDVATYSVQPYMGDVSATPTPDYF